MHERIVLSAPTNCYTDMLAVAAKLGAVTASASHDPASVSTVSNSVTPSAVTPQQQQSPPRSPGSNETSPFKVLH
jgi:hypothetical protein